MLISLLHQSKFISLLFFFVLLKTLNAQPMHIYSYCYKSGNYTANGLYRSNLESLISVLRSQSYTKVFYSYVSGSSSTATVYGNYLCLGDVSSSTCETCITRASRKKLSYEETHQVSYLGEVYDLHGLVQCTPDLNQNDCYRCLKWAYKNTINAENPGPQGKVGFPDFPPITEIDGEFRFPQQPNTFFDKQAEPWLRDSRFELDLLCSKYEELVPVLTVFFKNHVIMCLDTILVYNSYFDMHHQGTTGLVSKEKKKTPCLSARDLEMEVLEENDFKTGRKSFLKIIPSNHLSSTKSTHISLKSSDHPSKESGTIESPYQGFIKVLQYTTRHPFLNTATRTDNSTFLNS
ncbi:hypothetical protein DY000_02047856 [Brassica cretica]|uniref:Gnk2-homologous domain-containing protein n=1 Tax=Brassica cretica TaxID=69181 RepID=A0ABQ7F053_BRACR|nr:hypothetical protein DY000_02047856 [Brassica cretica]